MLSVVIATYNGEEYIRDQIDSILKQISKNDEIVVVDDNSIDNTVPILESLKTSQLRIYQSDSNIGHAQTFNRAIGLASNDLILLCDQDDIWLPDKYSEFISSFSDGYDLICSSYLDFEESLTNKSVNKPFSHFSKLPKLLQIILPKNKVLGCCIGFRKSSLLERNILPIPKSIFSHDLWIVFCCAILNLPIKLIDKPLLLHRIHSNNVTPKKRRNLFKILISRTNLIAKFLISRFKFKSLITCDVLMICPFSFVANSSYGDVRYDYIARKLAKSGLNVIILTQSFCHRYKKFKKLNTDSNLLKVITIPSLPYNSNISIIRLISHFFFGTFIFIILLLRILIYRIPKFLYLGFPYQLYPSFLLYFYKKYGCKIIFDINDIWPEAFSLFIKSKLLTSFISRIWNFSNHFYHASSIYVVTDRFLPWVYTRNSQVKPIILPIGSSIVPSLKTIQLKSGYIQLSYIGGFSASYDLITIIQSTIRLNSISSFYKYKLDLIGSGESFDGLYSQYSHHEFINFHGFLSFADSTKILRNADIAINPVLSRSHAGITNKICHYLGLSLPIVSSIYSPEVNDLMKNLSMPLYDSGDQLSLSNSILSISNPEDLQHLSDAAYSYYKAYLYRPNSYRSLFELFINR